MGEVWFDFSERLESIEWIEELPEGLVPKRIDLNYSNVSIHESGDAIVIYVGPKEPDKGGDGVSIRLDNEMKLMEYTIERIEPLPTSTE